MITLLDITNRVTAEEVLTIQKPAYQIEAEIMEFYELPPLHHTVEDLLTSDESFYGFYMDEQLVGAVSVSKNNNVIDIARLVTHPRYFRKGIAKALLHYVFRSYADASKFTVSTGSNNTPAIQLYTKLGFVETEQIEVAPNVYITAFEKIVSVTSNI